MLDKQSLAQEVAVGVTYSSLMSAVSLFFTGILISQYDSFGPSIKVPLIFLIISTFSFVFSSTVYNNAGSEITLNKLSVVRKYMIYGKNLMELLGLYPFILATPLVIGAVTQDNFLRTATILVAITGFGLYSQSKFSVLEKELPLTRKRYITALIVALTLSLYYFQGVADAPFIYSSLAVLLMSLMMTLAYSLSTHSKQYKPTYFRPFQDSDAEKLSDIILDNLKSLKAKHYSPEEKERLHHKYSAAAVRTLARKEQVIVAEFNDHVVGLIIISDDTITDVFTDSNLRRKGIGRMLVEHAETEASKRQLRQIKVQASSIDHDFYKRLGYLDSEENGDIPQGQFAMIKKLHD